MHVLRVSNISAVTFQEPFSKYKIIYFENGCWKVAAEILETKIKVFCILFLFHS